MSEKSYRSEKELKFKTVCFVGLFLRLRFLLVNSAANQPRPVSCNQSETSILVSDWLQLTSFAWDASEVDNYKRSLNGRQSMQFTVKGKMHAIFETLMCVDRFTSVRDLNVFNYENDIVLPQNGFAN